MKALVANRQGGKKNVFIFQKHQISYFQVSTKMILQNFVQILLFFQHEYSSYTR